MSFWVIGQQRTIEIVVSDTINIVPDELVYMFTVNGEEESSFGRLDKGKSIIRNLPPKYKAGLARQLVSSYNRLPRPPAKIKHKVSLVKRLTNLGLA